MGGSVFHPPWRTGTEFHFLEDSPSLLLGLRTIHSVSRQAIQCKDNASWNHLISPPLSIQYRFELTDVFTLAEVMSFIHKQISRAKSWISRNCDLMLQISIIRFYLSEQKMELSTRAFCGSLRRFSIMYYSWSCCIRGKFQCAEISPMNLASMLRWQRAIQMPFWNVISIHIPFHMAYAK